MTKWLVLAVLALACDAARGTSDLTLDVELDPHSRRLTASALLSPVKAPFRFILHESLLVERTRSGTTPVKARSVRYANGMREWLVDAVPREPLRIDYAGTLSRLDASLDHRDVLGRLPPAASEAGSFLGAGSGWYPAPGDFFTYRVNLAVRGGHKALVAGRLVREESSEALYRASFEFDAPADGIDLMAGPYEVGEQRFEQPDGRPLRLRTYFLAELTPLAAGYLADSRRYIERYSRVIGPYPFTEFSVVASPLPTGFGMPTLTYLGASVLKLPFIRATSLGHEVLHNWWGNGVYVDYPRGNWSEGLTTFMADYAYKEDESPAAGREMRLAWLRDFAAIPRDASVPLASFRARTHGAAAAVGYGKAAMLFFMTRDLIGDEAFARALRSFWSAKRFKRASWDDLREAFEQASGQRLGEFFKQWLERPGGPSVRIASATASGRRLELELEQSEPPYRLRVPVELADGGRAQMRYIDVEASRQKVVIPIDTPPSSVRLDPDLRLWRLLAPQELPPILRQWTIASDPALVVVSEVAREAAEALAARFFESPPRELDTQGIASATGPVLLAGLHADIDAALERLQLPPRPAVVQGKGTAQVWTVASAKPGPAVAVISAADANALRALLRPLPHYGSQSYLAFDGARAIERGVWPPAVHAVPVKRQGA